MTIFWNNVKRIFGRRVNLVFMVVVPVLLNVFIISQTTTDAKYNIGIQDLDQSAFTKELKKQVEEIGEVTILTESDDVKQMILDKDIDIAVQFDKGYTDGLIKGEVVKAKTYALDNTNQTDSGQMYLESLLEAARQVGLAVDGDETAFYKGMDLYYSKDYKVEYSKFATSINEKVEMAVLSLGYVAFGIAFLMMYATTLVLEDKINGVYDRICVTPLSMFSYYMQNLLSFFMVALIQIVLLFVILTKWVGLSYGPTMGHVVQTAIVCFAFSLDCIAFGLVASRFARTTLMANSMVMLVEIPVLMLGGCLWPRNIMPKFMQTIGDYVPTTWFLKAAEQVMYGKGILAVWQYVGGMLVLALVFIIIAFLAKTEKAR